MQGLADVTYTLDDFVRNISMSYLVGGVEDCHGVSWRGLPQRYHFQENGVADVFRHVLRDGQVSISESASPSGPLQRCIKAGWLHSAIPPLTCGVSEYVFASTWHKRYVECLLYAKECHINESNIAEFVINII